MPAGPVNHRYPPQQNKFTHTYCYFSIGESLDKLFGPRINIATTPAGKINGIALNVPSNKYTFSSKLELFYVHIYLASRCMHITKYKLNKTDTRNLYICSFQYRRYWTYILYTSMEINW